MTAEEQIRQLQTENQSLREQVAEALEQLGGQQSQARIRDRLAQSVRLQGRA